MSLGNIIGDSSILFITAGGGNYDILNSYRFAAENEPQSLNILCATKSSPIGELAKKYSCNNVFDFTLPCGKDGFLATNSLLAFNTLLLRSYNELCEKSEIPHTLESLVHPGITRENFIKELKLQFAPLLERDTYCVLFGEWGKSAAFDLESKFSEAALGNVQLSDYRNFGHGRHNWLAKRGKNTGIISFVTPDEEKIAEKTLALIPKDVPILRVASYIKSGPLASLDLLIKTMFIVDIIGESRNIDPGRPGVADFGIKLYNLHLPLKPFKITGLSAIESAAVIRKIKNITCQNDVNTVNFWTNSFHSFVHDLTSAQFGSIILDYDGTICEPINRSKGISGETSRLIANLLEAGITLGIATGRGKSVREDLQKSMPAAYWSNVLIGYYNGSDIGYLSDDSHPNKTAGLDPALESLMQEIRGREKLVGIKVSDPRPKQISFEPTKNISLFGLMTTLRTIVERNCLYGIQILESSHSIDVLAPNVTKVNLVKKISEYTSIPLSRTLCIGDKGASPGNDFALLSTKYSLSADTVSSDPNTCWNLAPLGIRGVQATLLYLNSLETIKKGLMQFNYSKLSSGIN